MEFLMFIIILSPVGLALFFAALITQKYRSFHASSYKESSGNSFLGTLTEKGNYGEYLTFTCLEKLQGYNRLLTNLYLPKKDGSTTEIDLVMLSVKGIYIFESKNYSGWIFGDETSRYWTQSLQNRQKNRFYNPIWQNKGHISAFKPIAGIENDNFYKSYIVFSERCTLKKVNIVSSNVKVINRYSLFQSVNNDIESSPTMLSREDVDNLYMQLSQYSKADNRVKEAHVEAIRSNKF